jgi:hypothetical protein
MLKNSKTAQKSGFFGPLNVGNLFRFNQFELFEIQLPRPPLNSNSEVTDELL